MKVKTTMRYLFLPTRMIINKKMNNKCVGEDVEKLTPTYTVDDNKQWCSHVRKQFGIVLKSEI